MYTTTAMATSILAKETASIPSENPYHPETLVKHFDVPVVPRIPLHIGQRVRVMALTPAANNPNPNAADEYSPMRYIARYAGVTGEVVRVRATSTAVTEFVVQNEDDASPVVFACIAIQHIQGQTVRLSLWERIWRVVVRPAAPERCIPLELDITIEREEEPAA